MDNCGQTGGLCGARAGFSAADLALQEADAARARALGMGGQPLSMPDALAIACSVMSAEARLSARLAGPGEREVFLRMAEAFRDPERVGRFLAD